MSRPRTVPAIIAIAVGGASLYGLLSNPDCTVRGTISNTAIVLAPICGVASTIAAWRRTRERAWLLLGAFCGLWAAGQILWAYYELVGHRLVPFPSPADAGYLGGAAFAVAASTQLPRRAAASAVIAVLDGLVVALSLVIVGLAALGPTIAAGDGGQQWLAIAYPASDVAVLTAMVTALPCVAQRWRSQVLYVVAGFVAIAIADVGFALLTSAGSYTTGSPIDLGWIAGFLLIAFGARRAQRRGTATRRDDADHPRWAVVLLPHVAVVPAAVAVLLMQVARSSVDPVFIYLGVALVPLIAARHVLTLLESERRAAALDREMTYDTLTGLGNRRTLSRMVDQLVSAGEDVAVVVLDIDDFKDVNDSAGPSAGDIVLVEVADRLRQSVSASDLIARVGGDKFAVVLRDRNHPGDAITSVMRLFDAFAAPFTVGSTVRRLTVSVGIASEAACDASDLLLNADMAMHTAKRRGKNRYAHFEPELRADAMERIELLADLEHAVSRGELVLHYQPLFRLDDGRPVGAEALVRWQHPRRGLLGPDQFIPIAEAGAHIETIGAWVLREATRFTARLLEDRVVDDDFHVAVNVAARQLFSDGFIDTLDRAIEEAELPASALVIELTESSLIDIDHSLPTLSAIRARGVRLAVDDFGTGYSSLSYLHRLPLDILKVDRSFVAHVDQSVELRAMTLAILSIGRSLGLATVAEGVERPAQLDELRAYGCTAAQGYLWSPPVSGDDLIDVLARNRSRAAALS
jgi:diguanylate cyclase (GGDEF)-like protein